MGNERQNENTVVTILRLWDGEMCCEADVMWNGKGPGSARESDLKLLVGPRAGQSSPLPLYSRFSLSRMRKPLITNY